MPRKEIYSSEEVWDLSQNFGLNDRQISEKFGCERATITKLRIRHNIPRCNLMNRFDKTYSCALCGKTVTIRRKDRRKAFCKECEKNK